MAEHIFTNNGKHKIWCSDTLTITKLPNPNTPKLFSHKYKVLSQNKSWNSIPSLGLHLIQREVFSSLHNPPQTLQGDLSLLHFATPLAHIEQNNNTSE